MEQKIIFFDIDGTLITEDSRNTLPDSTVAAIQQAHKNGHLLFINTGRTICNVPADLIAIGFNGVVCGCGTDIYADGKRLFYHTHPHEKAELLCQAANKLNMDLFFESSHGIYAQFPLITKQAQQLYHTLSSRGLVVSDWNQCPDRSFDKFITWHTDGEEQRQAFLQFLPNEFTYINRGPNFSEFCNSAYSKATGIQFLLDYYHLPLSNAYAIGDSNNDLTMLNYVPGSIAMGNSKPESLKQQVWHVTTDILDNGIWNALHFIQVIYN
ncbi:MAG: HAD-IIB family hydrolase [Lachnospiraceae bacterium]